MYIMIFKQLNENNFLMFTMKEYSNPQCDNIEEFYEDLNRVKYIKRLLGKYDSKDILRERLILNHLIILANVFGVVSASRILFYRIEDKYHSYIKSFLSYLNHLPNEIPEVDIESIPLDHKILKKLEKIK